MSEHLGTVKLIEQHQKRVSTLLQNAAMPSVVLVQAPSAEVSAAFALFLAKASYCQSFTACDVCSNCRQFNQQGIEDFYLLKATASQIKIDEAKDAAAHLDYHPISGCYRQLMIEDVDLLTPQAANSLLKTLEELPEHGRVILSTARPKAVIATIRSRAVMWALDLQTPALTLTEEDRGALRRLVLEASTDSASFISKELAWSGRELLTKVEIFLNECYKEGRSIDPLLIRARRLFLQQIRQPVVFANIHINSQLLCESLRSPLGAARCW